MTLEGGRRLLAEHRAIGRIHLPMTSLCWEIVGKHRARVRDESLPMMVRQMALQALKGGEELNGIDFTSDLPKLPEADRDELEAAWAKAWGTP